MLFNYSFRCHLVLRHHWRWQNILRKCNWYICWKLLAWKALLVCHLHQNSDGVQVFRWDNKKYNIRINTLSQSFHCRYRLYVQLSICLLLKTDKWSACDKTGLFNSWYLTFSNFLLKIPLRTLTETSGHWIMIEKTWADKYVNQFFYGNQSLEIKLYVQVECWKLVCEEIKLW